MESTDSGGESEQERRTPLVSVWDLPDVVAGNLPPHLQLQRTRVVCNKEAPTHVCARKICSFAWIKYEAFWVFFVLRCSWLFFFSGFWRQNVQYSGAYAALGVDNSLGLHEFRNNFRVEVIRLSEDDIEFDLIGIDASIANAFRQILIAEVNSLASTTPSEKALRLCFLLSFVFLLFFISLCQEILKIVKLFLWLFVFFYLCKGTKLCQFFSDYVPFFVWIC